MPDSGESDTQAVCLVARLSIHTLINEPATTSITPTQNGVPSATPSSTVPDAVDSIGVAYEPNASVSILPCSMPYPQHA